MPQISTNHMDALRPGRRFGGRSAVHYCVREPLEAVDLARSLSADFKDAQRIRLGLHELLLNAIEHGNLEIGFQMKTMLLYSGAYLDALAFRLKNRKYAGRHVDLYVETTETEVSFTIADQCRGFNPTPFLGLTEEIDNSLLPHGRGIAIAGRNCFDKLTYNDKGNVVVAVSKLLH